jgi:membrane protease YdiL (CAAX protease family)
MKQNYQFTFAYNPLFRVMATWLWWFIGAALTGLIILVSQGAPLASVSEVLAGKRVYLAVYIEIVSVGLLPLLFTWICKDELAQYGLTRQGLAKSLLLSSLFVVVMFGFGYLMTGRLMTDSRPSLHLDFPSNLWYALLGIIAWGPLEVFFFVWLVDNTDNIFKGRMKRNPWGLIITVLSFALIHIITTDVRNAIYTGVIFLVLGLIYKYTKNVVGPMIAWTLINGQVWYIARLLF